LDFTPKEAQTLLEELGPEIDRLDADAEEVTAQMGQVANRETRLQQAEQNLRYWAPRVTGDLSFHARRHLIELFVDRIEVYWEEDETIAFAYDFVFDPLAFTPGEEGNKGGEGVSIAVPYF
jgi:deferrochelatase/peroxidase EfeB